MKSIKLTYLLVVAVAMTVAATGCKKKPVGVTQVPGQRIGSPRDSGPTGLDTGERLPTEPSPFGGGPLSDDLNDLSRFNHDRETLAVHIVHFDFDSAVVKSSEKANVESVAAYRKGTASVALLIEGHCDERGTEEYNRSLGELRALALREALVTSGADASRITTRSFGEDMPVAMGHDESAWRQNRRGEFVVLHPK
jgi:peptidoglycan-associated lipoprotein